jgi:undecaprenyl-phosphate 4-deoxy-4-formamido-L-arabinose transferase
MAAPLVVAVGGAETSEFIRQSRLLWDAWPAQRPVGMAAPLVVAGHHHFGVIAEYVGRAVNMAMGKPLYLPVRDPQDGPLGRDRR